MLALPPLEGTAWPPGPPGPPLAPMPWPRLELSASVMLMSRAEMWKSWSMNHVLLWPRMTCSSLRSLSTSQCSAADMRLR